MNTKLLLRPYVTKNGKPRPGLATLWVILWMPVLVLMLVMVVQIGRLRATRAELENALQSAALTAAIHWADNPTMNLAARQRAVELAAANTAGGQSVSIDGNYAAAHAPRNPNRNLDVNGDIVLGAVRPVRNGWALFPDVAPVNETEYAARVRTSIEIHGIANHPIQLTAEAVAVHVGNGRARIVQVIDQ